VGRGKYKVKWVGTKSELIQKTSMYANRKAWGGYKGKPIFLIKGEPYFARNMWGVKSSTSITKNNYMEKNQGSTQKPGEMCLENDYLPGTKSRTRTP